MREKHIVAGIIVPPLPHNLQYARPPRWVKATQACLRMAVAAARTEPPRGVLDGERARGETDHAVVAGLHLCAW
jgi:hypothetical protein